MTGKELIRLIFKERGIILLPLSEHHESTEMIMSGYFEDKWKKLLQLIIYDLYYRLVGALELPHILSLSIMMKISFRIYEYQSGNESCHHCPIQMVKFRQKVNRAMKEFEIKQHEVIVVGVYR